MSKLLGNRKSAVLLMDDHLRIGDVDSGAVEGVFNIDVEGVARVEIRFSGDADAGVDGNG